jgi:hypothetical protein
VFATTLANKSGKGKPSSFASIFGKPKTSSTIVSPNATDTIDSPSPANGEQMVSSIVVEIQPTVIKPTVTFSLEDNSGTEQVQPPLLSPAPVITGPSVRAAILAKARAAKTRSTAGVQPTTSTSSASTPAVTGPSISLINPGTAVPSTGGRLYTVNSVANVSQFQTLESERVGFSKHKAETADDTSTSLSPDMNVQDLNSDDNASRS